MENNFNQQAERLRNCIESTGMVFKEFAKLTGVTNVTLSKYLSGNYKISDKYLKRASAVLGVSVDYLKCSTENSVESFQSEKTEEVKIKQTITFLEMLGYSLCECVENDAEDIIYIRWHEDYFRIYSNSKKFKEHWIFEKRVPPEENRMSEYDLTKKIESFGKKHWKNYFSIIFDRQEYIIESVEFYRRLIQIYDLVESICRLSLNISTQKEIPISQALRQSIATKNILTDCIPDGCGLGES